MAILVGTNSGETIPGTAADDIIDGLGGDDTLQGLDGDDVIIGGPGDDIIDGGNGSDALYGDAGADQFEGGAGWDYVFYSGASSGLTADLVNWAANTGDALGDTYSGIEVLVGTNFADNLLGDAAGNFIYGGDGDDFIFGRDGDDSLIGGAGKDTIVAGAGRDRIYGGDGDDTIYPAETRDYSVKGEGKHYIDGGNGYDFVHYDNLATGIYTNLAEPRVTGNPDWLETGDVYVNVEGLVGTAFRDILIGDGGDNWFYGLGGDDLMSAGSVAAVSQAVHFIGGDGNDTMQGGSGDDWIYGDDGNDIIRVYSGSDHAFGGAGDDRFEVNPDSVADWYDGGSGNDTWVVWDAVGTESLAGDIYIGGSGIDTIDLSIQPWISSAGLVLDLVNPSASGSFLTGAAFDGIENIIGTHVNDSLRGNSLDNRLEGLEGIDWLYGRGGNDTLLGGDGGDSLFGNDGNDTLTGGQGFDHFYFGVGDGLDTVTDFQAGVDTVHFASALGVATHADVMAKAAQVGSDVVITFDGGTSMTLGGVQLSALSSGDFVFF